MHPAFTQCPACRKALPEDALFCSCGTILRATAMAPLTPAGKMLELLHDLGEGIGWKVTADGCARVGMAGCMLIEMHAGSQVLVSIIDTTIGTLVRSYAGGLSMENEQRIAAAIASLYVQAQHGPLTAASAKPAPSDIADPALPDLHIGGVITLEAEDMDEALEIGRMARREVVAQGRMAHGIRKCFKVKCKGLVVTITRTA